jgi:hypothetical protein
MNMRLATVRLHAVERIARNHDSLSVPAKRPDARLALNSPRLFCFWLLSVRGASRIPSWDSADDRWRTVLVNEDRCYPRVEIL